MTRRFSLIAILLFATTPALAADWQPKQAPLMTRWAKDVSPDKVHPEYPRPQMVRKEWQNLNGLWDYAIRPKDDAAAKDFGRQDPRAVPGRVRALGRDEAGRAGQPALVSPDVQGRRRSGAASACCCTSARSTGTRPSTVNGKEVGEHRGGYDPFTFDITDALSKTGDEQEIVVSVCDPTDAGFQPRGKQVRRPHGIWYTPTTGIWQTVWLGAGAGDVHQVDPKSRPTSIRQRFARDSSKSSATRRTSV